MKRSTKPATVFVAVLSFIISASFVIFQIKEDKSRNRGISSTNLVDQAGDYFLIVSDIHLDVDSTDVKYHHDTGMSLWDKTVEKLDSVVNQTNGPDFVLYLGDLPAHKNWGNPRPPGSHERDLDSVLTGFRQLMDKASHVPFIYLPGNNDAIWGDYCEFSDPPQELPPFSLDQGFSQMWPAINVPKQSQSQGPPYLINDTHRDKGYYSLYPLKNKDLRVIALNTVIFSVNDCDDSHHPWQHRKTDADEMLRFLDNELDSAAAHNEKVIIAMHIPPGLDTYCRSNCTATTPTTMWDNTIKYNRKTIQERFLETLAEPTHQQAVVGVFTSHTHMDEIRLLSYHGDTIGVAISAPGISPNHGQNPGFKKVYYEKGSTYELTDFRTLYTTLDDVQDKGRWGNRSYTFRDSYQCATSCNATTIMDCIRCKNSNQLYDGMTQTFGVKMPGIICCDLRPMMLVTENQ